MKEREKMGENAARQQRKIIHNLSKKQGEPN